MSARPFLLILAVAVAAACSAGSGTDEEIESSPPTVDTVDTRPLRWEEVPEPDAGVSLDLLTEVDDGWIAVGDPLSTDYSTFGGVEASNLTVWHSTDLSRWDNRGVISPPNGEGSGSGNVSVTAVGVVNGTLVAIGAAGSPLDDSPLVYGPSEALVWTSVDGGWQWEAAAVPSTWERAPQFGNLPLYLWEGLMLAQGPARSIVSIEAGSLQDPADVGPTGWGYSTLTALGETVGFLADDRDGPVWMSFDGSRWSATPTTGLEPPLAKGRTYFGELLLVGDELVLIRHGPGGLLQWTSADGTRWVRDALEVTEPGGIVGAAQAWGDQAVVATSALDRNNNEFCYQDTATCRQPVIQVFAGSTAETMDQSLRISWLDRPEFEWYANNNVALVAGAHLVLVVRDADRGASIWRLVGAGSSAGGPDLPVDPTPAPTTTVAPVPSLADDDLDLVVGEVRRTVVPMGGEDNEEIYGAPGCVLPDFNGGSWDLAEGPAGPLFPDGWPVRDGRAYVEIELTEPDTMVLTSTVSEARWVFVRAVETRGCVVIPPVPLPPL